MIPLHVFRFLWFSYLVQLVSAGKCPPSVRCGYHGNIEFHFTTAEHPDCGIFVIRGCDGSDPGAKKSIKKDNRCFDISYIDNSTIVIADNDLDDLLLSRSCNVFTYNYTFRVSSPLASSHIENGTLFRCSPTPHTEPPSYPSFSTVCSNDTWYVFISSSYNDLKGCTMVQIPVRDTVGDFPPDGKTRKTVHIVAADSAVASAAGALGVLIVLACCFRRCLVASGALGVLVVLARCFRRHFCNKENLTHQIIEKFLKDHGNLGAKRYSYLEVKKAANSFKNKLGQGGYGSVYKGKLDDGSLVAVTVLSESKGNGEEFINEVASISVTSHVNIVSLLGFCLEGPKRALIYKYVPNGSLEKFIYEEKDPLKVNLQLSCKTIYNIAIGVARGLEYLHKGCNSKILHFDIKPHNILLDEDFCPKISDFVLAKICPRKESIVSLLGARGTAGYTAPELFSRNFGGVSHKSDVYSYGMMVLVMVGGRQNNNVEIIERSSEIYSPHWIYKRLELNQEPRLRCIKNEMDKEMVRNMIIVSLWCIQTDPSNLPAMSKVVDVTKGSLESLQIPPKPYLSSPPRSPTVSSDHHTQTET